MPGLWTLLAAAAGPGAMDTYGRAWSLQSSEVGPTAGRN